MSEIHRVENHFTGHPCYEVMREGKVVGKVFGHNRTIERARKGATVVDRRWESKRRSWCADYEGSGNPYRSPYDTRKQAIEAVLSFAP